MSYIYNDEDNAAMNDDFLGYHNPTVYLSRAEMEYYESGQADRDYEDRVDAIEYRESQIRECFLDNLQIERDSSCRRCSWMNEILGQFDADDDGNMPAFCYGLAKGICETCQSNPDRKDEAISDYWDKWEAGEV